MWSCLCHKNLVDFVFSTLPGSSFFCLAMEYPTDPERVELVPTPMEIAEETYQGFLIVISKLGWF